MSLVSLPFAGFAAALIIVYYCVPHRWQWCCLFAASVLFYYLSDARHIVFIVGAGACAYVAALAMRRLTARQKQALDSARDSLNREQRSALKKRFQHRRRLVLTAAILALVGALCCFKYLGFLLSQFAALAAAVGGGGTLPTSLALIAPLGISFYTFQTVGYVVDVYWEKCEPQRNFAKLLTFVTFFPQITQGPIGEYEPLSQQLFAAHPFCFENYAGGALRMLWGYFKKMVIADRVAAYVALVFANYAQYSAPTVLLGAFLYSVQIYADFSGYMDIVCGLSEMLGVKLSENFLRPYFSKSIAEYWRRWHITLGSWFKKYIYYPIAVSRFSQQCGRSSQKLLGKTFSRTVPATIALVVVWLTTGLWHGASWAYIAWGGCNGLFIILSLWLEPVYKKFRERLHISDGNRLWQAVQVCRTFFLITLIKVLPEVGTLRDGLGLWARIFTGWRGVELSSLLLPMQNRFDFAVIPAAVLLLFIVSLLQRKRSIRSRLAAHPLLFGVPVAAALFLLIICFGYPVSSGAGGFLYAQF